MGRKLLWLFKVRLKMGLRASRRVDSNGNARGLSARIAQTAKILSTSSRPGGAPESERAPSRAGLEMATWWDGARSPLRRLGRPLHECGVAGRGTGLDGSDRGPAKCHVESGAAVAPHEPPRTPKSF